jgi:acyl phosphate:glycerol-3-phosphate acyltransferase
MSLARVSGAAVLGYLLGTFPTADLVARRVSGGTVDLRVAGTGNPGGANALKVLGARAGYTVMAGDIAKGAMASTVGRVIAGSAGAHAAGTAAVIGHCLPVWNGGKGGKGVATTVGQCLATFPAYFPIDVAVAAATAANPRLKQRAFTATMVASACWVAGAFVWWRKGWRNLWGPRPDAGLPLSAAISSAVVAYKFVAASRAATPVARSDSAASVIDTVAA